MTDFIISFRKQKKYVLFVNVSTTNKYLIETLGEKKIPDKLICLCQRCQFSLY